LLFFAYKKFIKHNGKPSVIILSIVACVGLSSIAAIATNSKGNSINNAGLGSTEEQINKSERPKIDNAQANAYLDAAEQLLAELKQAKAANDNSNLKVLENRYTTLHQEVSALSIQLRETKGYVEFMQYNAKLMHEMVEHRSN